MKKFPAGRRDWGRRDDYLANVIGEYYPDLKTVKFSDPVFNHNQNVSGDWC